MYFEVYWRIMAAEDPTETLQRIVSAGHGIKFGKGVVGKTGHVAAALLIIWGIIAWRLSDNIVTDAALLSVGIVASTFAVWFVKATQKFAQENPAQAILEGAELIEWRRMEIQVGGKPVESNPTLIEDSSSNPSKTLGH